jgi:teichuronic acid biosynthesis glycosyltransferase TuaC
MTRIALVTPMLPVPHDMTRGRYIFETARSLSRLADVRVFFMQQRYPHLPGVVPRSFLYGLVGPDYRLDGLDMDVFSYPAIPVVTRRFNGLLGARALKPRMQRFNPDLVLAYWVYPDGYAALRAARAIGVPCAVGALGSDIHVRSGHNAVMTRRTIAGIDALLTVSENMRQAAIAEYGASPDKVHTVVNGYNTQVFRIQSRDEARASLGIPPDARLVIYVGRFVEAKGMRELLGAFQKLSSDDPKLRLALVGDGVMRDELVAMVRSANLGDRVLLPGGLPPESVAQWIAASDALTLPSWSEGYPNVVVEAIACGRPVVATDVGGTCEIVNEANGILIPARDERALADALLATLNRSWDERAIAATIQRTWDDVAADTLAICQGLCGR